MKTTVFIKEATDIVKYINGFRSIDLAIKDMNKNISRIQNCYESNQTKYSEISCIDGRDEQSSLKWLLLAFKFFSTCFLKIELYKDRNVKDIFTSSYQEILECHHNMMERTVFKIAMSKLYSIRRESLGGNVPKLREIQKFIKVSSREASINI